MRITYTHFIKAGYGYWDTTNHPIGGCFRRVSKEGDLPVEVVDNMPSKTGHGYLCRFKTADNREVWADERAFRPFNSERDQN